MLANSRGSRQSLQIFFRDAAAAFVVFDLTRRTTFEAVRRWKEDLDSKVITSDGQKVGEVAHFEHCTDIFNEVFTKIPTVLLANKSDLNDQRSVTDDEVYKLSRELGFTSWYSVSAREGDNVDTAGDMIVSQILQREVGLDKMERLLRWPERGVRLKDDQGHNGKKKKKCC